MNAMWRYISGIASGAYSLVSGMAVTLRYMFKPVATVQYPRDRLELPEAYRGHIELKRSEESGGPLCVACGECMRNCPSSVIKVRGEKSWARDHTVLRFYFIDYSKCSFCGVCVEVCPQQALAFSFEYQQAFTSRYQTVVDLTARMREGAR